MVGIRWAWTVLLLLLCPAAYDAAAHPSAWPHYSRRPPRATLNKPRWTFEVRYFNQTINHFSAYGQEARFQQRYLLNRSFWGGSRQRAPMFFFTGAEGGDVERVSSAYGHVLEMAERMQAMVVFMEGRYFGKSQPFGSNSYEPHAERVGLLSVEQMLLDYVQIITALHAEFDSAWECPTLAFGGSLAGTLSAMMRLKYPSVVDMSLASSAPLRGYVGQDQYAWRRQVTDNWKQLSESCPIVELVRRSFEALRGADPSAVQLAFGTCEGPYAGNWQDAQGVLWQTLESEAEFVYPSSASPIPAKCQAAQRAGASGLDVAAALLQPHTGCLNLTAHQHQERSFDALGWSYMSCTEIVHPIGCNNLTDFFPPSIWSVADVAKSCTAQWGVAPLGAGRWIPETFGFDRLAAASRVLFAYGEMDPWYVFAVGNLSSALPVLTIPGGSHCADMEGSRVDDTAAMKAAREQEEAILRGWLADLRTVYI